MCTHPGAMQSGRTLSESSPCVPPYGVPQLHKGEIQVGRSSTSVLEIFNWSSILLRENGLSLKGHLCQRHLQQSRRQEVSKVHTQHRCNNVVTML